jgi:hypothetical protein
VVTSAVEMQMGFGMPATVRLLGLRAMIDVVVVQPKRPKRSSRLAWRRAVPMREEIRSLSVASSG